MGLRVEMLLRTKQGKKMATQGRDPPSFGAPKACSSWEQEAKICPRGRAGQGRRETRDGRRETEGGSASRAWHFSGLQASEKSRFLF